jgi:hypothetical protein
MTAVALQLTVTATALLKSTVAALLKRHIRHLTVKGLIKTVNSIGRALQLF